MLLRSLVIALALGAALPASASVTTSVDGRSNPWDWSDTLNSTFQFGANDGIGPTIVTLADAGITAGGSFAIVFKDGATSAFGGAPPSVDQSGYVGSAFKDNDPGSSGNFFPSHYMSNLWSDDPGAGVFLNALVFVFTDDLGQIVGSPDGFQVGGNIDDGYLFFTSKSGITPVGATRIQLGVNDDIFSDNSGALRVCVGANVDACSTNAGGVPEPATWGLMIAGFGLAGAALRSRRRAVAA